MEYPWQQLKKGEIDCQQALSLLIDERGTVNLELLDPEVGGRFFRLFSQQQQLPPVVPLLLWRNCYYLGSPLIIEADIIQKLSDRTFTDIKILSITEKSYSGWFHIQNLDLNKISGDSLINPLTNELESENIAELTELYLSKASDQIQRVKTLFSAALRNRASDIHLEPMPEGLRVRYRIDGVLRYITTFPLEISRRVVVATKVMSDLDIGESRRPQDGRISQHYVTADHLDLDLDMRVSTFPCVGGEKAVIRLLPRNKMLTTTIEDIGFMPKSLEIYRSWVSQPQGLIIVTGPTGSGKTSTLYATLQLLATDQVNIITMEDPIEYNLSNITQGQVHEKGGLTFATGLKSILRQDPDIIMVGEVRDL